MSGGFVVSFGFEGLVEKKKGDRESIKQSQECREDTCTGKGGGAGMP